jgi:hypothetical protein
VVLEQNYLFKMKYSPDYKGVDKEEVIHIAFIDKGCCLGCRLLCLINASIFWNQAVRDFKERVRKYEEVYETLSNRNVSLKLSLALLLDGR